MKHYEKPVSTETIYKGKVIELKRDKVELENGRIATREVAVHPGAVVILAKEGDDFLFVRQYRYAVGQELLEAPAGKLEKGEEPMLAAARELREETGMVAENLVFLGKIFASPGILSEEWHIYFADDLKYVGEEPDEGEFLSVERISTAFLGQMLHRGEINDSKTLCALFMAKTRGLL